MRSRYYDVKYNFKKLHKNGTQCRFGCLALEDKNHALLQCQPLNTKHKQTPKIEYSSIFLRIDKQIKAHPSHILPGGHCQDPCKFNSILLVDYATDLPLQWILKQLSFSSIMYS